MIYKKLVSFVLLVTFFVSFASVGFASVPDNCYRWEKKDDILNVAPSQFRIEIYRDGVLVNQKDSAKTASLNYVGMIPNDIVFNPPTIQAKVGDVIRVVDLTEGSKTGWDFQKFKDGRTYHGDKHYFYGSSPFPYEKTITEAGDYTYYLNVHNGNIWSAYGDYRVLSNDDDITLWWYFTHLNVKAIDEPDPIVSVNGSVNPNPSSLGGDGKANISVNVGAIVNNLRTGETVQSWELALSSGVGHSKSITILSSNHSSSMVFENIVIEGVTQFKLTGKVTTNKGDFEGVAFVNALVEDADADIGLAGNVTAKGRVDAQDGSGYSVQNGVAFLDYSYSEFNANVPKLVNIRVDGSESTSDPHSISDYYFALRKNNKSWSHSSSYVSSWDSQNIKVEHSENRKALIYKA